MKILGIETSCDETAAAVVTDKKEVLSNLVLSQMEHAPYLGVVPEIAARAHLERLDALVETAMEKAGLTFAELDGVAATAGPGLIGGVLVGVLTGKMIAAIHNKPFIAVNHLEGHALSPRLTENVEFPYLLLLVSGGHCQLLIVRGAGQYTRLGTTLDDAVGEAFDKTAKQMGLGYPGGPAIEKMALECMDIKAAHENFPLPHPRQGSADCHFSFSGLKTAASRHIESLPGKGMPRSQAAMLCAAFQDRVAEILAARTENAIKIFKARYPGVSTPALVVAGGVAANAHIRDSLKNLTEQHKMAFAAPPLPLCSDNAAMIAWAGVERLKSGLTDPLDFRARPRWPLDPDAPPATGAGVKA